MCHKTNQKGQIEWYHGHIFMFHLTQSQLRRINQKENPEIKS